MKAHIPKRDAAASRQRIIDEAKALFFQKGYAATSMEELAAHAQLNKAMIFYYFKNKKGLYEAVMEQVLQEIYDTIVTENRHYHTPQQELESFVRTYAKFACTHPYLPTLLLKELGEGGAVIPDKLFGAMRRLFALFCDILRRGEAEGSFHETMPMVLYFMVIGTINLMVTTKPLRQRAAALEDIDLDTCVECEIEEISEYLIRKINLMLKEQR